MFMLVHDLHFYFSGAHNITLDHARGSSCSIVGVHWVSWYIDDARVCQGTTNRAQGSIKT